MRVKSTRRYYIYFTTHIAYIYCEDAHPYAVFKRLSVGIIVQSVKSLPPPLLIIAYYDILHPVGLSRYCLALKIGFAAAAAAVFATEEQRRVNTDQLPSVAVFGI